MNSFNHTYRALFVLIVCVAFAMVASNTASAQKNLDEYQLKTLFIYDLMSRSVVWPDGSPANICIVGENPFKRSNSGSWLDVLKKRNIGDTPINVMNKNSINPDSLASCRVLFISDSVSSQTSDILDVANSLPLLTISETEDFIEQGGMIRFTSNIVEVKERAQFREALGNVEKNIQFGMDVSESNIRASGLVVSSKLREAKSRIRFVE